MLNRPLYRPEIKLLLCCARTCINSEVATRIKTLLHQQLDWDYLLQIAMRRGAIPLLYWNLNATHAPGVPGNILNQLRNYFLANAQKNLLLTKELLKLLAIFEAHQIPAIPYKGPILAASVYGNLSLRQFNDLDILVSQQDLPKAKKILIAQGYRSLTNLDDNLKAPSFQASAYNLKFQRNDGKIDLLELHWRVTPPYFSYSFELESFWKRLKPVSLGGVVVRSFSPEDLLLVLCIHGAKDDWRRLGWVCDVAELIKSQEMLNWDWIVNQANKLGCERMLYLGLFMAHHLLETALPQEVWAKIQADPMIKLLAQQMCDQLFAEEIIPVSGIKRHIYYLRLRERWRDKIVYLAYQARSKASPNTKDQTLLPLPTTLSLLYYPLRPMRLIKEYGRSVWQELHRF